MAKYDYNLAVIGAGSAGLVSSYIAAAAKAKVALVERHKMGGDCLNTGCVPSKALIRSAAFLRDVQRAKSLGFAGAKAEFNFADIMDRVARVVKKIEPHDSVERYTGLGVDCVAGEARVVSPHCVEAGGKKIVARSIVVAAGARPFVPKIAGLEKAPHCTSDTIWSVREQPRRLLVVGGGPIGCELAQAFAYLGSQVTQVEGGERILAREDADAAEAVMRAFAACGVEVLTNSRAAEVVEQPNGGRAMRVENKGGGEDQLVPFDLLLIAAGRAANGHEVPGLKEAGVEINERGVVRVNDKLQTTTPNIFACGDIIGAHQFTHTAAHAAVTATINALAPAALRLARINWSVVPWCTFTHPEVARVGLSEQEARAQNIPHEVAKYGIDDLDRAIADEEAEGFVKVLTVPGKDKILGATIVGHHAGDLLHEYVLAMKTGVGLKSVMGMIHIYPTLAEANRFAASEWKKAHLSPRALAFSRWLNAKLRG